MEKTAWRGRKAIQKLLTFISFFFTFGYVTESEKVLGLIIYFSVFALVLPKASLGQYMCVFPLGRIVQEY